MKKIIVLLVFVSNVALGQSDEAKQLLLNVEKLAQFKAILKNMKDGYQLLHQGYTAVKDISQGNFNLHKTFLDGLMQVSPLVKKYQRVAAIIGYQLRIAKEYKAAYKQFRASRQFSVSEIEYLGKVYANLLGESLKVLDELAMVVIAGKLRMSDDERLAAIDRLYEEVVNQYTFLNEFNDGTAILSVQREKAQLDIDLMKKVHGVE